MTESKTAADTPVTTHGLSPLGYKIFLDRYALKDGSKKSLAVGDTVVVCVDVETGQREIGKVVAAEDGRFTIELNDGTRVEKYAEHIDKPLELTPAELQARVARGIASVEQSPELRQTWEKNFRQLMEDWKFVPGGRILTAAGSDQNLTLYNCFVLSAIGDSRGGIVETLSQMMEIMSRGGGVGINVSSLRPRHAYVKGVNGRSSGAVSWGGLYSFVTGLIEQGGSRRGALMLICDVWHPDVVEFITSKTEMGKITNANISVGISDAFMEAIRNDEEWELVFPETSHPEYEERWDGDMAGWRLAGRPVVTYRRVKARELWNKIIESAWASAEPGLFFVDRYNAFSNSWYYAPIRCTNPCFAGSVRLATDQGWLTFEELWRDQTEIRVVTDLRAVDEAEKVVGASFRHVRQGSSLRRATPVFKTGENAEVLRLITEHGYEVTATPDHRFLTPSGYAPLQELKPGDVLYLQSGMGAWNREDRLPSIPWTPAARAKLTARQKRGEAQPPVIWTREIGHVLGWAVGDGYTYDDAGKPSLGLLFGKGEEELLPYFRNLLRAWFGVSGATADRHNTTALFYHATPATFLRGLGLERVRAHEKQLPDALWRAPKEAVAGFLQALFTCDGTVNISPKSKSCSIRLASSSEQLLKDVQLLLLNFRVVGRLRKRREAMVRFMPDSNRQPKAYESREQFELIIDKESRDGFLSEIGFLSPAKQAKARQWLDAKVRRSNYESFTTRVAAVEPAGCADVYDTTEPTAHSLIANGCVTHNCGEQGLPGLGVCNLGAINLSRFADDHGRVRWDELGQSVRHAVRFLDNVIDATPYFFEENERQQKSERRVGLGTMGLAELLIRCGVRYGSPESMEFIDRLYRFIAVEAYLASADYAAEKGSFPQFDAEKLLQSGFMESMPQEVRQAVGEKGLRNVTLLTQAPTGTTGTMVGTSTGIEPFYFWSYYRKSRLGMHEEKVSILQEWLDQHGQDEPLPDHFVTAMDLTPEEHVRIEAAIQRWVDSSISKTCNVPNHWTVEQTRELYELMYRLGCKGGTIYRDGSRDEQVLHLKKEEEKGADEPVLKVRPVPKKRYGVTVSRKTPAGTAHITMNDDEEGRPFEIFVEIGKGGSDIKAMAEALGRMMSLVLRLASPLRPKERIWEMINQLEGIGGARSTGFGPGRVRSLPDAVAQALTEQYGNGNGNGQGSKPHAVESPEVEVELASPTAGKLGRQAPLPGMSADLCPSCGDSTLVRIEGCHSCYQCGYAEC